MAIPRFHSHDTKIHNIDIIVAVTGIGNCMQVTHSDNAVWDITLALRAVQLGLGYRVGTVGARFQWFLNLTLVWFPMHACGRVAK